MKGDDLMRDLEKDQIKTEIPEFRVGDTVKVSMKIIEGEKERIQVFQGTVIARKGKGLSETISLHRVSYGEGMERVFSIHSPRIVKIEVVKHGDVRKSKLYYLRGTSGKAAKVDEKIGGREKREENLQASEEKKINKIEKVELPEIEPENVTPASPSAKK